MRITPPHLNQCECQQVNARVHSDVAHFNSIFLRVQVTVDPYLLLDLQPSLNSDPLQCTGGSDNLRAAKDEVEGRTSSSHARCPTCMNGQQFGLLPLWRLMNETGVAAIS